MTEQAAQDPNMPPMGEAELQTETVETPPETAEQGQAETATAGDEGKGDFVDPSEISERTQARINKITAEKHAERRQREELERKLAELEANTPQQPAQTVTTGEPTLEQYDYDEQAYNSALIDWKVNQNLQTFQQQQQQQQAQAKALEAQAQYNAKVEAYTKTAPDFFETVQHLPNFSQETLDAIMQADNGPQLAHYLGKHLDVADEIASANPMVAAMKLGQISAQLTAPVQQTKPSAASDPIEPVGSGGVSDKAVEEMSMEEIYNL